MRAVVSHRAVRRAVGWSVARHARMAGPVAQVWARSSVLGGAPLDGPRRWFSDKKGAEEQEVQSGGMFAKVMGFVRSAIEGPKGSAESGFATVLCEGLRSTEIKAQRHSAKELSWMCGDDNRHLGLAGGAIHGNRLAVIEAGGLEALVPLLKGGDPKTTEHVASALAGIMKHEPAIAMIHDLGGTAILVEVYNRSAGGKLDQLRENVAKSLQRLYDHEPAREVIEAGVPDYEDLQAVDLGQ